MTAAVLGDCSRQRKKEKWRTSQFLSAMQRTVVFTINDMASLRFSGSWYGGCRQCGLRYPWNLDALQRLRREDGLPSYQRSSCRPFVVIFPRHTGLDTRRLPQ